MQASSRYCVGALLLGALVLQVFGAAYPTCKIGGYQNNPGNITDLFVYEVELTFRAPAPQLIFSNSRQTWPQTQVYMEAENSFVVAVASNYDYLGFSVPNWSADVYRFDAKEPRGNISATITMGVGDFLSNFTALPIGDIYYTLVDEMTAGWTIYLFNSSNDFSGSTMEKPFAQGHVGAVQLMPGGTYVTAVQSVPTSSGMANYMVSWETENQGVLVHNASLGGLVLNSQTTYSWYVLDPSASVLKITLNKQSIQVQTLSTIYAHSVLTNAGNAVPFPENHPYVWTTTSDGSNWYVLTSNQPMGHSNPAASVIVIQITTAGTYVGNFGPFTIPAGVDACTMFCQSP